MPQRPTLQPKPNINTDTDTTRLLILLEQWTRADVMSRIGVLSCDVDYARTKLDKENEIRILLYGTCCLVELGKKFGLR